MNVVAAPAQSGVGSALVEREKTRAAQAREALTVLTEVKRNGQADQIRKEFARRRLQLLNDQLVNMVKFRIGSPKQLAALAKEVGKLARTLQDVAPSSAFTLAAGADADAAAPEADKPDTGEQAAAERAGKEAVAAAAAAAPKPVYQRKPDLDAGLRGLLQNLKMYLERAKSELAHGSGEQGRKTRKALDEAHVDVALAIRALTPSGVDIVA